MYLLYADESGTLTDAKQKYFVLAGLCLFERQGFWVAQELDKIAARFDPADPTTVELHGNPMKTGKGIFRRFQKEERINAIVDSLKVFQKSHPGNRVFAAAVNKATITPDDPVEHCFEQLASRFDHYLGRLHKSGDTQRGIIIFDKSTYESTIQSLATDFRTIGHRWGLIRNFSEVPLFLDSRASRLIQLADLIAYGLFQSLEHNDHTFYDIIKTRFDSEGGVVHGFYRKD
jgi:hypothetical protein